MNKVHMKWFAMAVLSATYALLVTAPASAQTTYDASDTEITIGNIMPYCGLISSYTALPPHPRLAKVFLTRINFLTDDQLRSFSELAENDR
jgi:hypothetical protein